MPDIDGQRPHEATDFSDGLSDSDDKLSRGGQVIQNEPEVFVRDRPVTNASSGPLKLLRERPLGPNHEGPGDQQALAERLNPVGDRLGKAHSDLEGRILYGPDHIKEHILGLLKEFAAVGRGRRLDGLVDLLCVGRLNGPDRLDDPARLLDVPEIQRKLLQTSAGRIQDGFGVLGVLQDGPRRGRRIKLLGLGDDLLAGVDVILNLLDRVRIRQVRQSPVLRPKPVGVLDGHGALTGHEFAERGLRVVGTKLRPEGREDFPEERLTCQPDALEARSRFNLGLLGKLRQRLVRQGLGPPLLKRGVPIGLARDLLGFAAGDARRFKLADAEPAAGSDLLAESAAGLDDLGALKLELPLQLGRALGRDIPLKAVPKLVERSPGKLAVSDGGVPDLHDGRGEVKLAVLPEVREGQSGLVEQSRTDAVHKALDDCGVLRRDRRQHLVKLPFREDALVGGFSPLVHSGLKGLHDRLGLGRRRMLPALPQNVLEDRNVLRNPRGLRLRRGVGRPEDAVESPVHKLRIAISDLTGRFANLLVRERTGSLQTGRLAMKGPNGLQAGDDGSDDRIKTDALKNILDAAFNLTVIRARAQVLRHRIPEGRDSLNQV